MNYEVDSQNNRINYNHHLLTFTWETVKQLDSHFEGILIVTNCIDSVI